MDTEYCRLKGMGLSKPDWSMLIRLARDMRCFWAACASMETRTCARTPQTRDV